MNEKFKDTDLREALRRNYANVPEMRTPLQLPRGGEAKTRPMRRWLYPIPAIAASILIAFLLWPKGETVPIAQPEIQQPVVAEVIEPESPQPVRESAAEPVVAQAKQQKKPKTRVARTAEPVAIVKQEEKPEVAEENLLAEAQNTPLPKGKGESPLDEILPPERQALIDIYLAEEALQVAYKQQEQTQELRAFTARLQGKEPETSHLITAF